MYIYIKPTMKFREQSGGDRPTQREGQGVREYGIRNKDRG
jgi:hypothetical protein